LEIKFFALRIDERLSKKEIVEKFRDNLTDNNHSDFLIQLDDFVFGTLNN